MPPTDDVTTCHDEDDDPTQYIGEDVEIELALVGFADLVEQAPEGPVILP